MQDKPDGSPAASKAGPSTTTAIATPASRLPQAGTALVVFTATTFLSALLLFSVQPMFAKMVLPILGGSPSVWAVAMVFFQASLLAGYCYAHVLIRTLSPWRGGLLHLAVTCTALLALPIGVPASFGEPPPGDPALWQLGLFAAGVGLPFFAVSANAPLLQAWFAASGHPHARDPYFLYAASNLGSLVALLAYPTLLEPAFGVSFVAKIWAAGFVALIAALLLSLLSLKRAGAGADGLVASPPAGPAPPLGRRLGWIGLAFVPSALLTAFTTHITMDVASAPLLWVLPLSLYLLTFVLVFRDRPIALIPAAIVIGLGTAAIWPFLATRALGIEVSTTGQWIAGLVAALGFIAALKLIPGTS
ncbi:MAG: hypothetical protein JSS20_17890, partial [Proteobacteria bacterium]|nr:hypothetical protein [Pseudomonadota bacterium]